MNFSHTAGSSESMFVGKNYFSKIDILTGRYIFVFRAMKIGLAQKIPWGKYINVLVNTN
jgi:hypothetical protein